MNARLRHALLLLLLFVLAWVPRMFALNSYVSPDERKWLARSANFAYAVGHGDFANTFQREHPGVTVMWAGTLGILAQLPDYVQQAPGYFTWERENFEEWVKANTARTPLDLLASARWWIALGVTLALWLSYFPLRRLLGAYGGMLAFFFLALAPFGVAMSRQLHPDGFVATLTFLALLEFLAWLYGGRRWRDLVASGVVMGLAWLTKTPAALLVPTAALLIALELWHGWRARRSMSVAGSRGASAGARAAGGDTSAQFRRNTRNLLLGFVAWGAVAVATFVLLWPAMWTQPLGTLQRMATEMEAYVEGHVNPNFFWGQPTVDPGPLFYPIAYLFRVTPATLIGLMAIVVAGWRREWPLTVPRTRQTVVALALFALIFFVAMTVPAKKFDRYILPAFLALDVVAAVGWLALVQWPWQAGFGMKLRRLRIVHPGVLALAGVLLLHGFLMALAAPYYLTYFNPLLGGSFTAPRVLFVGWGEGLDAAARWLNQLPDAGKLRVVSWYADGPFSYFFKGQPVPMGYSSPLSWLDTDYVVTYVNQWQRQVPSPEAIAWFEEQTPVYEAVDDGLALARVYDLRDTLLPPFIELNTAAATDFGGKIRLVGQELTAPVAAPGGEVQATFYLQGLAPIDTNYNVLVRLVGPDGREIWREEGWPWGAPTTGWPVREVRPDGHRIAIPADAAPGIYKLLVSFYDPATLQLLPAVDFHSGQPIDGDVSSIALVQVGLSAELAKPFTPPFRFADSFELAAASVPITTSPGVELPVSLQFASVHETPEDYTVFVHLVAPDGTLVAQQDRQPLAGFAPTHTWLPGQRVTDEFSLALPANLAPGSYEVRAGLYTAAGRLPVTRTGGDSGDYAGDYAPVGTVVVE